MNPLVMLLMLATAFALPVGLRQLRRVPRPILAERLRQSAVYIGVGFVLLLIVTGRLPLLFALLGGAIALGFRLVNLLQMLPLLRQVFRELGIPWPPGGATSGSRRNNESTVQARFVRMSLDHARGELRGQVLEGRFAGHWLSELTLDELIELLAECRADNESSTLIQAYLDKVHGDEWRTHARRQTGSRRSKGSGPSGSSTMDAAEAWQVLGLAPGAGKQAIIDAHRRLMQKVHPDRGGSDYLAAKLNQAKDVLLGS